MVSDLAFALRQLAKAPGFAVVALLTLALGVGSATVGFAGLNAFLFRPLPHLTFPEDRLQVLARTETPGRSRDTLLSFPDFTDLRTRSTAFAGLWASYDRTVIIAGGEVPERQIGTEITWDAFAVMGLAPVLGRGFTAGDAQAGAPTVALISHGLWRSRFGGRPEAVGTEVMLNGQPARIIGVMPAGWRYPDLSDVWTPLRPAPEKAQARDGHVLHVRGRLRPEVPLAQAQAEVDGIMAAIAAAHPATHAGVGVRLQPLREHGFQQARRQTLLLFGVVMAVFVIACLNVANLLFVRGIARAKEMAVRSALGATRGRLVRQLVTENFTLGVLGGALGVLVGLWGVDAMTAALPTAVPFWLEFTVDARVLGFSLALSVAGALAFGIAPALRASQPDLGVALKECRHTASGGGARAARLRNLLVIVQLALALVLLVGAGLMLRSYLELRRQHLGFETRHVLTFRTGLPPAMFGEDSAVPGRFFADLLPRLAALPGVEAVGAISLLPGVDGDTDVFQPEGALPPGRDAADRVRVRLATAGYFDAVRVPLLAGRGFDDALDRPDAPRAAVVDETLAVKYFGSVQAALGRRFVNLETLKRSVPGAAGPPDPVPPYCEIVGVVGAVRHRLDQPAPTPTVYLAQSHARSNFLSVVVRTAADPTRLLRDHALRDAVMAVNRDIPIYNVLLLEEVLMLSETVWPRRFFGGMFALFGLIALLLACVGIYGVMAYSVSQRGREIGIRIALGAPPRAIVELVLRHGLRLVGWGLALGVVAALLLAPLLVDVLYGVPPHDPMTFGVVPLLLAAVALAACWLPGRRALTVDPNLALRTD